MSTPAPPQAAETSAQPPRSRPPAWFWAAIAAAVIAAAVGIAVLAGGGDKAAPTPSPTPSPSATQLTPEAQAEADMDQLVRDYEEASNAAFLDPSIEPAPALDDYLRSPALDDDVEQIINVHSPEGIEVAERAVEVHSVEVTALDLAAAPPTATVEECRTITAAGTDKQTGESQTLNDVRRLVIWSAVIVEDDRWRLYEAVPQEPETC